MHLSPPLSTSYNTTHTEASLRVPALVGALLLIVLALVPRLLAPGDFWTADEAKHWSVRVDTFLPAVQEGNYAATNLVGHPGVTTMWLGSLGVLLHQGLANLGVVPADDPALYRMFLRVPIAIVTSLCIGGGYLLLRRLIGNRIALMTALLWIGDPFLVAHSKVLHVDALLTSFLLISMLAAMAAVRLDDFAHAGEHLAEHAAFPRIRWGMLALSAITGGLALLTKSPSMILFPMIPLIALVGIFATARPLSALLQPRRAVASLPRPSDSSPRRLVASSPYRTNTSLFGILLLLLLVWGCIAAGTWIGLWPAAWLDPIGSMMTVINEIFRNGAEPHGWGNFFMGRVVGDPGPLFYPVAIDLRLNPASMIGLFAAAGAAIVFLATRRNQSRCTPLIQSPAFVLLVLFALVFTAIMTILAKKFDRYVLPVFPILDMVAAYGLLWLFDELTSHSGKSTIERTGAKTQSLHTEPDNTSVARTSTRKTKYPVQTAPQAQHIRNAYDNRSATFHTTTNGYKAAYRETEQEHEPTAAPDTPAQQPSRRAWLMPVLWALVVGFLALNLAWFHPYELAYYNQFLGGGEVAENAMYVGWGEGLEKAAAYINKQHNGCELGIASWYELVILPYSCTPVLHQGYITVPGHVHYAVLYVNQVQRQIRMNEIAPYIRDHGSLVHTVKIHGIDYAYVYQLQQPRTYTTTADFGSAIRLTGYDVDTTSIRAAGVMTLTLQWLVREEMDKDYMLFVHVFDNEGNQVGHADIPPGGLLPTTTWGHGHFIDWMHRIPVDPATQGDTLWIALGMYDPADFARLPLNGPPPPAGAPNDGANALVLDKVRIRSQQEQTTSEQRTNHR